MSSALNKVILIGNIGRDPEIRTTQSGNKIANMVLATGTTWLDKNTNEKREKTEWHRIVIFNERFVKIAENYLKKGSKIYLEGELRSRKWTDQNGVERFVTEIILQYNCNLLMLDSKSYSDQERSSEAYVSYNVNTTNKPLYDLTKESRDINDDDIPF